MTEQLFPSKPVKFISRDEMNLAEFPLTVLSTRSNPKIKTLEFKDSIYNKKGQPIQRKWIITGADKFGLPTSSDDEVLLGLLKLTVDKGFGERKIYFTRYELLKILRWTTEGRSYSRLQNALDRLSGVRIKASNAFFDNEAKMHSTRNFGILDAYELNDGRDLRPKPSFFIWSEVLFKSFQVGFIKKLDLDFFLNLNSAVTKRLYRYLDKHFWYKSRMAINLFTLAHEKVGVSRNYKYPSSIKQQIDPAVEELIQKGFLSNCEYSGRGKGTEIVFYAARGKPRVIDSDNNSQAESGQIKSGQQIDLLQNSDVKRASDNDELRPVVELLVERGLKEQQVVRLLDGRGEAELERAKKIIDYYDSLMASESHLVSKNSLGFLYRAIQRMEHFVLPGEARQTSMDFASKASKANGPIKRPQQDRVRVDEKAKSDYLIARKKELKRLKSTVEPELLQKTTQDVEEALARVKGVISEANFKEAVEHAVEEKLAKLFAYPDFDEWLEIKEQAA